MSEDIKIRSLMEIKELIDSWLQDEQKAPQAEILAPAISRLEEELLEFRRRQSEDLTQMAQTARMAELGMMAAAVFHEMNQPLLGIKGFAEIGFDQHGDGRFEKLGSHLQEIRNQVVRIQEMQQRVKTFLHLGDDQVETFRLKPCIDESLSLFRYRFHSHRVEAEVEMPADLPRVRVCRKHLQQVLINLIANALDAQQDQSRGRLRIAAELIGDKNKVRVLITDFGPGIKADMQEKIFDPFVTDKGEKGTGLGLYISRRLMRANGGSLRLIDPQSLNWSEQPATVFEIVVPGEGNPAEADAE